MFQLFAWREGEQRGGYSDYLKDFESIDEALDFAMDLLYEFDWQIVDASKHKIVSYKEEEPREFVFLPKVSHLKELN